MPFIGYLLGAGFEKYINAVASWIAFVLLALIGGNMIREALSKEEENASAALDVKTMFLMAVATSIDALAVGITLRLRAVEIMAASPVGEHRGGGVPDRPDHLHHLLRRREAGSVFGARYKSKAESWAARF